MKLACLIVSTSAVVTGLSFAPPAFARCNYSTGVTMCEPGEVPDRPQNQQTSINLPVVPYPCEDDWLCDDGGLSIVLDADNDNDRPQIDNDLPRPDRPDRPNRPGRG